MLDFAWMEGELDSRLAIWYHNFSGAFRSANVYSICTFKTVEKPVLYSSIKASSDLHGAGVYFDKNRPAILVI